MHVTEHQQGSKNTKHLPQAPSARTSCPPPTQSAHLLSPQEDQEQPMQVIEHQGSSSANHGANMHEDNPIGRPPQHKQKERESSTTFQAQSK